MVTFACGGNILKKTYDEAIYIIITLVEDSRQYCKGNLRNMASASRVDKDDYAILKEEFWRLKLKTTNQQVKACDLYHDKLHPTDSCPTMQEDVNAIGGFQRQG